MRHLIRLDVVTELFVREHLYVPPGGSPAVPRTVHVPSVVRTGGPSCTSPLVKRLQAVLQVTRAYHHYYPRERNGSVTSSKLQFPVYTSKQNYCFLPVSFRKLSVLELPQRYDLIGRKLEMHLETDDNSILKLRFQAIARHCGLDWQL